MKTDQGWAQLIWSTKNATAPDASYELQQSKTKDFAEARTIYKGPDLASFVSGLSEGNTWYRVRYVDAKGLPSPWASPVTVEVTYADANFVTTWLIVGAVVFVVAVVSVVRGHFSTRHQEIV